MGSELPPGFVVDQPAAPAGGSALPPGFTVDPPPERTWWDTAKSVGQTADDAVRAAANTITFGMADRLAGTTEGGTDAAVRRSQEARVRSPVASVVGDLAGGAAIPGIGAVKVTAMAGGKLIPRVAAHALEGGVIGGLQGAGNTYTGNPWDYVENAKTGGLIGGAAGGVLGGILGPRSGPKPTAEIPSAAQTARASDLAYEGVRQNPTQYHPPAINPTVIRLEGDLQRFGVNAPTSSEAARQLRALDNWPTSQSVTPAQLDVIRRQVNTIPFSPTSSTDREAAHYVRNAIDDFIS